MANFRMIEVMDAMLDRIGFDKLTELIAQDGNIARIFEAFASAGIGTRT